MQGKLAKTKEDAKKPLFSWSEYQKRLPTEAEIKDWWNPKNAVQPDVAIVTGPISKILVVDIDGEEGEQSLKSTQIQLPLTWEAKTKRGRHLYFKWQDSYETLSTTKAGILTGLDIRGAGGFVVCPPSLGSNGVPYSWRTAPFTRTLVSLPVDFVSLFASTKRKGIKETLDEIKEGNRNDSLTSIAGSLRARGYRPEDIYHLLEPKARELGVGVDELRGICQSVGRYAPNDPVGSLSVESESFEEFINTDEKVEWLIDGVVPANAIGFIAGLPETGKTWTLFDFALEAARGGTWLGRFPIKKSKVLVIDQERSKQETRRRFKALMKGKRINAKDIQNNLCVQSGTTVRIDLQQSFEAFARQLDTLKPDIVIIDSFKTFHTRNELTSQDMQLVLSRIKELRTKYNCAFLFVHHETKGVFQKRREGAEVTYLDAAGTIDLAQTAEVFFNMVGHGDKESILYHTKNTQGSKQAPVLVRIKDLLPDSSSIVVEAL